MHQSLSLWPFAEAKKILDTAKSSTITLATGYGPSGLPHIGTFGEVLRTTAVIKAIKHIDKTVNVRLLAFSDDMDGLRKVPENVPSRESLKQCIGKPLTSIPDPFGTHESYGAHMNARLKSFLDSFDFEYTFMSSTECYKTGVFNEQMKNVLAHYDAICDIMLPSLGSERQTTYSPFLPLCAKTGRILEAKVIHIDIHKNTITYLNEDNTEVEQSVLDGNCKLQWKPDWGMRWVAFGIDFEAHGKDLIPSAKLSSEICKVLGGKVPILFSYELFLDAEGKKISKSKGNGISIEQWLEYGPKEGLAYYILKNPKSSKKLSFDIIPKITDEYIHSCKEQSLSNNIDSLTWFVHKDGLSTEFDQDIPDFSLLINLASACNPENRNVMLGFIKAQLPTIKVTQFLNELIDMAIQYYNIHVKPYKTYKTPSADEAIYLKALANALKIADPDSSSTELQNIVFEIGKQSGYESKMKDWFSMLYAVLFGQESGPKIGSFAALYGLENFIIMLTEKSSNHAS